MPLEMVIDLDKCFACQVTPPPAGWKTQAEDQADMGRAILWNKVPFAEESILISETMILVHVCIVMIPPVSKSAVQATYKNEEGVVLVDYERCIGCRFCTVACAYQVRYFNWFTPEWRRRSRSS